MATLIIKGLDKNLTDQLNKEAHHLNMSVNELAKQLIYTALNSPASEPTPNIHTIFGIVPSETDGLQFQNKIREE